MSMNVWVKNGRVFNLQDNVITAVPTVGAWLYKDSPKSTIQATVAGTGAVTATVVIEVTNDNTTSGITLGTITLSGTTTATDGFTSDAPWKYIRSKVTAISGTGANVNVLMGV